MARRAGVKPRRPAAQPDSEAAFQRQVLNLAEFYGWRSYHTHDSRRSQPGFPDLVLHGWFGYVAPAGTPKDNLDKLGKAMRDTIKDPAIVASVQKMDFNEAYLGPEELRGYMRDELPRFTEVAKREKIEIK